MASTHINSSALESEFRRVEESHRVVIDTFGRLFTPLFGKRAQFQTLVREHDERVLYTSSDLEITNHYKIVNSELSLKDLGVARPQEALAEKKRLPSDNNFSAVVFLKENTATYRAAILYRYAPNHVWTWACDLTEDDWQQTATRMALFNQHIAHRSDSEVSAQLNKATNELVELRKKLRILTDIVGTIVAKSQDVELLEVLDEVEELLDE
ncbi:MAG: hypothetical protein P8K71_01800 [Actinomycetota bacterium]|nr:hypothetical protein [Actinomycetota bacterium]